MNFMNFDLNFCISLTKEEAFLLLLPILYANSGNPSERCILSSQSLKRCTQNYITLVEVFHVQEQRIPIMTLLTIKYNSHQLCSRCKYMQLYSRYINMQPVI